MLVWNREVGEWKGVEFSFFNTKSGTDCSLQRMYIYMCVYIYICAVESKFCPRFAFFESKIWPRLSHKSVQDLVCLFPPPQFYSVLGYLKNTQIVCRGAKNVFLQVVEVSKKRVSNTKSAFFFGLFMLDKAKEKRWKNEKNQTENSVIWGGCEEKRSFFVKMTIFRKIGKHYLCSEGKEKTHIFVATICFGKMVLCLCPFNVTKHYKTRGFSRYRRKPKMALLVAKVPFWEGASKGGFTICNT